VESVVSVVSVVAVQPAVVVVVVAVVAAAVVVDIVRVVHIDTPVVAGPIVAFEFGVPVPFLDSEVVVSLVVAVPIA
jgi:hypothetical protein